ncbi:14068_t:CDS:2 [Ambispora leptoticha]|uniref:14068_t:CDS:1 n=1 Tax=Ambispora leptoticha TaxID=144679 RepID=A0A9N8WND5_9GLOM|nr:14068_t:CDS:2 [Ambispora leptoticha]
MAQPYRIQGSRSGKRILPQSIQDNTGVARNRLSRRGDRISRTTSSKNSCRRDVISFSIEEAGETSMNSNEPASTVEKMRKSQTKEEREYSPSPREGFTTNLDKDTIVICSR